MNQLVFLKRLLWQLFVLATILIFVQRCAQQVRPSGGPTDKTPPRIISVTPANNATLVAPDQRIEFEFSERMNRKTVQNAIFITPDPGGRVELKWKGRKLRVEFDDPLSENRTYVITLGTGLKDLHGNAMAQSYTLAFSTGEKISAGKISGTVFTEGRSKEILIWAYFVGDNRAPDPAQDFAAYITQTDAQGRFELSHLSKGTFRLFAIQDKDNNRYYEVGEDGIGVPQKDVWLASDSLAVDAIYFRISTQDTLGPALTSVSADHQSQVALQFDEEVSSATVTIANFRIREKSGEDTLTVRMAYVNLLDPMQVILTTEQQRGNTEYELSVWNLTDLWGNLVDQEFNSGEFSGSALPDTFRPRMMKIVPQDSAWAVFLNTTVELHFSEVMDTTSLARSFHVQTAAGDQVTGALQWQTPASVRFTPAAPLQSLTRYEIAVALDSVFDLAGNAVADSAKMYTFTSINVDTLSSISGQLADPDSTAQGRIRLQAGQTHAEGAVYKIWLDQPGSYTFQGLLPGTYQIEGFRDRNGNGRYDFGQAVPFEPAERFFVYRDSIKIRARWPNEGNDISF